MTIEQFKKQLDITSPFVFVNIDPGMTRLYIDRVAKAISAEVLYVQSLPQHKLGQLINKPYLYVYVSNKIDDNFFELQLPIIQVCNKIDKRKKVYTSNKQYFVEMATTNQALMQYVGLNDAKDLIKKCDSNLALIKNVLKSFQLSELSYDEFKHSIKDISQYELFEAVYLFMMGNTDAIKDISPFAVFGVIVDTCKKCLCIKTAKNKYDLSIGSYEYDNLVKLVKYKTNKELIELMRLCIDFGIKIKQGRMDAKLAMDYLIIKEKACCSN